MRAMTFKGNESRKNWFTLMTNAGSCIDGNKPFLPCLAESQIRGLVCVLHSVLRQRSTFLVLRNKKTGKKIGGLQKCILAPLINKLSHVCLNCERPQVCRNDKGGYLVMFSHFLNSHSYTCTAIAAT